MADGLIQKTEDRGQKTEVLSRRSRAFNKRAAQRHTNICLLSSVFCLLMPVLCPLNAEELRDPTRPPAMIFVPDAGSGLGAVPSRPSSGLQTIIISESRRAAIIDGHTVELGAKHGNARLVEVNEGSVTLQGTGGRKMLTLFPSVKINKKAPPKEEVSATPPADEEQSIASDEVHPDDNNIEPNAHEEQK